MPIKKKSPAVPAKKTISKVSASESTTPSKKFVLLDDAGRLFGKYDLFIPLFILVVLTLGIMIARVLMQKEEYITVELFASGGEWWWDNPSPPYWLADPIKRGTVERDPQGNVLVEVLEARKFEEANRKLLWMKVKLRVTPDKKSGQVRFRRENLQVGSVIYVAPNNVKVVCNVLRIEGMEDNRQEAVRIVTVNSYAVSPWYADNIKVGDVMRDSDGKILAEVIDKKVELSDMTTVDAWGNTHVRKDSLKRDVSIKIRMQVTRAEGIDYFSYFLPLKKNFYLAVPFETMNIDGTVVDFTDEVATGSAQKSGK